MMIKSDKVLDATGLLCPEPVMMLHRIVKDADSGDIIKVLATDPSTSRDIPKFCSFLGHELLAHETLDQTLVYYIQKG